MDGVYRRALQGRQQHASQGVAEGRAEAALQRLREDQRSPRNTDQTRRRLRGRQPLCGIGVTSRIEVTVKPADCRARNADSRPEPGPETSTSSVRMPCSEALRAASSAATWAA